MEQNNDKYRLLYAAYYNNVNLIKSILFKGVDIDSYDYDRRTALHIAACEGHVDTVKYLLCHGASL